MKRPAILSVIGSMRIWLLSWCVFFIAAPSPHGLASEEESDESRRKALTAVVSSGAGDQLLVLWSQKVSIGTRERPLHLSEAEGLGNRVYYVVRHALGEQELQEEVVWIGYFNELEGLTPNEDWLADFVWDSNGGDGYVVVARSTGSRLWFEVFEMDSLERLADFPMDFNPAKPGQWVRPPSQKPLSTVRTWMPGICGLSRIDVLRQESGLLIYGQRPREDCPEVYFRFDLESRVWTTVGVDEKGKLIE